MKKSDIIMHHIMSEILEGKYSEGELLPGEIELSQQFNSSRTSIRAALQTIANKKVISILPKKGSIINNINQWNWLDEEILAFFSQNEISKNLLLHLLSTRLIFEPSICSMSALTSTAEDLAKIENAYLLMKNSIIENDRALFIKGDNLFHQSIMQSCRNPFLSSLDSLLSTAMSISYENTLEINLKESEQAIELHGQLLESIRKRESYTAHNISRTIIIHAIKKVLPSQDVDKLANNIF
ncbi:FadR/GntR family transcriptional regulator [Avibacterium avium]|uniref:FadR/GntR family transcriptional regulator n=1 Tax=Avibacterium avium TaxID=751 RepID=UPI003BF8C079